MPSGSIDWWPAASSSIPTTNSMLPEKLAPLSDAELAQIVAELAPILVGASAGKAYLRDSDTLLLELGRIRLVLSAHPRASRIHPELAKTSKAQSPPPPFAMLVRKHIGGVRLRSMAVVAGERVVTLDFGTTRIIAELTGPHANLFVVGDGDLILGALRRSQSTTRVLAVGHLYAPPTPAPANARWRGLVRFGTAAGVTERVACWYAERLAEEATAVARARAAAALRREIDRLDRRERALLGDLERSAAASKLRKFADLLLAHVHSLPGRGARSVTVPDDFEDGTPLTFPVDPALDVRQNAARFYRQHKRLTGGRKHTDSRLAETRAARAALIAKLASVDTLDVDEAPPPRPRRPVDAPRLPYRELQSLSGDAIWVGRGASDNDALTFRHARGGDLWFHCRDAPGAHIVVPHRSGKPLSEATFLDAAMAAAHYSPLSGEAQVDIMYTHVKNLRRPKGAPPGRVFAADAKTVRVRLEPERLTRLLTPRDPDGDD